MSDTVTRMSFLYQMYNQAEIDHILKTVASETVTNIANEIVQLNPKYEEGGAEDTDENAERTIFTVVDELGDRIKAEVRFRVLLSKKEKEKEKK